MEENPHSKYMPKAPVPAAPDVPAAQPGQKKHAVRFVRKPHFKDFEQGAQRGLQLLLPGSTINSTDGDESLPIVWKQSPADEKNRTYFWIVLIAQVVSTIFSPFYLPVLAFVILFMFSYLNMLPPSTKVFMTLVVYFFTVLLPHLNIFIYRKLKGWTRHQLSRRERRYVPYVLSILSYATLLYLLYLFHMPRFTLGIIAGALVIQVVCALVNSSFKVSTHAAASGGVIGAILAFSLIFGFDPTPWLCIAVIVSGLVCTSRLILRQHTLQDLGWGVVIGLVSGFACILFI